MNTFQNKKRENQNNLTYWKQEVKEWKRCIKKTGSDVTSRAGLAWAQMHLDEARAQKCKLESLEGCSELFEGKLE